MLTCSVDLLLLTECQMYLCQICGSHCTDQKDLTFIGPCIANIFAEYNQQDATFHNLFISVRRSTCFRRFLRPSSGAQNCTYNVRYLSDQYLTLYVQFWTHEKIVCQDGYLQGSYQNAWSTKHKIPIFCCPSSITHTSAISNSIFITLYIQNSYHLQLTSSFLQTDRPMRMWPCVTGWVVTVFPTIIMPSSPTAVQDLTCWVLKDTGTLFLQNIRNHSPNTIGSHPRRPESSATTLCEPHVWVQYTQVPLRYGVLHR